MKLASLNGDGARSNREAAQRSLRLTGMCLGLFWSAQALLLLAINAGGGVEFSQLLLACGLAGISMCTLVVAPAVIALATTAVCCVAIAVLGDPVSPQTLGLSTVWASAATIVPAIIIDSRQRSSWYVATAAGVMGTVLLVGAFKAHSGDGDSVATALSLAVRTVAIAVAIYWGAQRLRLRAADADDEDERLAATRHSTQAAVVRAAELAEARRLMHDTVINSLVAIRLSGVGEKQAVIAQCQLSQRELWAYEDAASGSGDVGDVLRRQARRLGLAISVVLRGKNVDMPADVRAQLLAAAGEALTNVRKHARCAAASVLVDTRNGVTIEVSDNGVGFDVATVSPRGLQRSIADRVELIGATADINSTPGSGTTVTLRWRPISQELSDASESDSLKPEVRDGVRDFAYAVLGLVGASAICCFIMLTVSGFSTRDLLAQLLALIIVASGAVVAVVSSRGADLSAQAGLIPLIVAVPIATMLASSGPLTCSSVGVVSWSWLIGAIGIFIVGVLARRTSLLVLVWLLFAVAMIVTTWRDTQLFPECVDMSVLVYRGGVLVVAGMLAFRFLIARFSARATVAAQDRHANELEQERRRQHDEIASRRVARSVNVVAEFLDEITAGHLDPTNEVTRQRANEIERYCRAVIDVPDVGPLVQSALLNVCGACLTKGFSVSFGHFQVPAEPQQSQALALVSFFDRLLEQLPAGSVVKVSTPSASDRSIRIVVDASVDVTESGSGIVARCDSLDGQSVIDVSWNSPPTQAGQEPLTAGQRMAR